MSELGLRSPKFGRAKKTMEEEATPGEALAA
jgi:hypothetical protein